MAKISRKPKKKEPEGFDFSSNFQAGADALNAGAPPEKKEEKKDDAVSTKDLLTQIGEMNARIDELNRTNLALMSNPRPEDAPTAPAGVDMKGLPDPALEPEKYGTELATRIEKHYQEKNAYEAKTRKQEQDRSGNYKQLFEDFAIQYPDYVANDDRVEFVAAKVVEEAHKRGIDIHRYMFGNTPKFFSDLKGKWDNIFGAPKAEEDQDDGDEDTGRTEGILGGQESGGRPSTRAADQGDMVRELHDLQKKSGFY